MQNNFFIYFIVGLIDPLGVTLFDAIESTASGDPTDSTSDGGSKVTINVNFFTRK